MDDKITLTKAEIAAVFAEWQRQYKENPEQFDLDFFNRGSYGEEAAVLFVGIAHQLGFIGQ